ncbi:MULTISPECIES: hypothetical protein [Ruegeria]|uniref:Uncharacterized protein n=1 Tax=Ruegeria atlantica TaxID=81569 RepID=A0AA91BRC7_9RHOB|nr:MULTISPECIES: hypothetical protein [Ruegeria]NOC47742.1 hypothetical protein [Ruegeria sp. HKCCD7559]NOC85931.1 hypothetical protein [Ruegeria sp. HKCCD6428]NOC94553.1 hypothetical protein [Ruegeria sp. HKCCD6604]NOD32828.1 hypothetical protein [Ruegeria atlantica]NOD86601.1 hypothetical protein [Ruegeria sp. HKCCD6119]
MSNRTFLTLHSTIYALFAFALFFLPGFLWPNYGLELNDRYAWFLSQHNSIFLGGIAIIGFLLRDVTDGATARKLLTGLMATNALGFVVTLYAALTGIFTGFGWSDPAFFAFLAVMSFLQLKKLSQS